MGLIDLRSNCPRSFKAEKVEPDQVELLRDLGAMDIVLSVCTPIRSISVGRHGKVEQTLAINQFGVAYEDMVNVVRKNLPDRVEQITGRVTEIQSSPSQPAVTMASGQQLRARLIIVATGTAGKLTEMLGVERRTIRQSHSLCCGFDMKPASSLSFDFEALTYHAEDRSSKVDFITIFPIGSRMRANIFTYAKLDDSWVAAFADNTNQITSDFFPNLTCITGAWKVCSKVQTKPIHLYTTTNASIDGVVLVGDAFQSVCPSTGTGVSKVLMDAYLATKSYVPVWMRQKTIGASDIRNFYSDQRKKQIDERSLRLAANRRDIITGNSIWAHIRRARQSARRFVSSKRWMT